MKTRLWENSVILFTKVFPAFTAPNSFDAWKNISSGLRSIVTFDPATYRHILGVTHGVRDRGWDCTGSYGAYEPTAYQLPYVGTLAVTAYRTYYSSEFFRRKLSLKNTCKLIIVQKLCRSKLLTFFIQNFIFQQCCEKDTQQRLEFSREL